MFTKTGTIKLISGHPMSGLWQLLFEDGSIVHVQSGYGVRQLAACFGATEGKGDLQKKIQGQEIVYSIDSLGVLYGFTPIDEWEGPEVPEEGIYESEQEF